jgi:hypothetical protein
MLLHYHYLWTQSLNLMGKQRKLKMILTIKDKKKRRELFRATEPLQYAARAMVRSEAWNNNPIAPAWWRKSKDLDLSRNLLEYQKHKKQTDATFKMPNRLTKSADINVAATPIKAHNPLNSPIIDGFKPVNKPTSKLDRNFGEKPEKKTL